MGLFNQNPFYHETIRKFIIAFGHLFSGIKLLNYDNDGNLIQEIGVPISYGPKNKWLERIKSQPNPEKGGVGLTLPRLAFEITDYRYDAQRKVGTQGNFLKGTIGENGAKLFNPVPYDVTIKLHTMTKDQDDSLKILEQILPYFSPHLMMEIEVLPTYNIKKNIPLVLNTVQVADLYDGGTDTFRSVIQTFEFTAKLDLFGPIYESSTGIIKQITVNQITSQYTNTMTKQQLADYFSFYNKEDDGKWTRVEYEDQV
jgi:hypothetical protein